MIILDGKTLKEKIIKNLKMKIEQKKIKPGLAVILVGDNPASQIYVKNKVLTAEKIGYLSKKIILSENTSKEKLVEAIKKLNKDSQIHGILIQLPLPSHLKPYEKEINNLIDPKKDVDCFHPENMGRFFLEKKNHDDILAPCTPKGIIRILKEYDIEIAGKKAVVIGRSNIVGKPVALMLCNEEATVTIAHSQTKNLEKITREADILIVAVGKPLFVKKEMVKRGSVVVDVGINRLPNGKVVGDVDFENVKDKCLAISPVPGGIGPMTVASLMENLLIAYNHQLT
ncbi:MAG: bifunctional 5,10-methylenetetrahydrofolate dehydrogenase/5,10-methenyltetrahydrofolate cyclohydrolase [Patescibacteria group bacterium]|nr:bifunctional 5,10-methylenetetrahydrofolate dehydrogenase/5,10-methenyltetrahydrofolate cyclohydrolase [Patescibacteria group bacterium]